MLCATWRRGRRLPLASSMPIRDLITASLRTLPRDGAILFVSRFTRLFAYGALSVILVFYLVSAGLSESPGGSASNADARWRHGDFSSVHDSSRPNWTAAHADRRSGSHGRRERRIRINKESGFVVQSFAAYWFYLRFGIAPVKFGLIFFWANVLAGISALLASRLATRMGLVRCLRLVRSSV